MRDNADSLHMSRGQTYNITVRRKGSGKDQTYEGAEYYGRAGEFEVFLLDGSVTLRVEDGLLLNAEPSDGPTS